MSEDTVKLGLMPPLTGLVGIYGAEILRAGQIACQEINENGGVLGKPLELIIEDDGSLPESSVEAAKKLVDEHGCVAIIGNLLSNSRIAVAYQVAEPRKIPLLNFSFYEGSILSRYFFHFAALPNQQIEQMIPYMKEQFGSRMFFAGNNYEWPRGSIHAGKRILESIGGEVVGEEYCPIGVDSETIERLLDHVEQADPDVFVPYFAGIDQVNLLTRFTERGLKNKIKVVMGHFDEMMASQLSAEVREGFYSSNTYFMTVDSDQNRDFLKRLANYPGVTGIWPKGNGILTNFSEGTYACVKAFAKAANEFGSIESESLVESLENISVASPQGLLEMNPDHHHAKVNAYLSRCRADGEFEIIKNFGAIEPVIPERYSHQRIIDQATVEADIRLQARMLEQMSEAVLLISSQNTSILYNNVSAENIFGYEKGELNSLDMARLVAPTDSELPENLENIISKLNQKGQWKGDLRNIKKNGAYFWCSITVSTFTHPLYGEVWLAVFRDISKQKKSEERQKQTEERLNYLVSSSPVTIYTCKATPPFAATYISPNIKEFMGFEPKQFTNNPSFWADNIHPEDSPRVFDGLPHLFENDSHTHEYRFRMSDGRYTWMMDSLKLIRDKDGNPIEIIGNWSDNSKHRQAAEALASSEEKLRLIHSRVPGIVYQFKLDKKGNKSLPYVSPTIDNYLGVTSQRVMDDADVWFDLTHPEDRLGLDASIVESMTQMITWDWIGRFIRDDNDTRWFHGTSTPEKLSDGSTLWNGVFIDITKQKKTEVELEKHRHHLEDLVVERTADLSNARDEAEKANASKSDFLSSMSHELRTPMNAILGFGQLLELDVDTLNESQQSNVKEILDAGKHLLTLINEVLDLAKIESGNLEVSIEGIQLENVIQQCLHLIKPQAEARHIEVVNNISEKDYTVQADITRLKQVLLNILSNAIKYNSDNGKIILEVSLTNSQCLRLCITDTGKGLNDEEISKLFLSFERLDAVDNVEGTGIGLVITKHLIELMNGTIGVESTKGTGSTFWIELPMSSPYPVEQSSVIDNKKEIIKVQDNIQTKSNHSVLYIEDNPANMKLVTRVMALRSNTEILKAIDPFTGLEMASKHQPDLILLDINLPGIDGYEVLKRLRQQESTQNIPVIAVSANAMKKDIDRGMAAGFESYITKPIDVKVLLEVVNMKLQESKK